MSRVDQKLKLGLVVLVALPAVIIASLGCSKNLRIKSNTGLTLPEGLELLRRTAWGVTADKSGMYDSDAYGLYYKNRYKATLSEKWGDAGTSVFMVSKFFRDSANHLSVVRVRIGYIDCSYAECNEGEPSHHYAAYNCLELESEERPDDFRSQECNQQAQLLIKKYPKVASVVRREF